MSFSCLLKAPKNPIKTFWNDLKRAVHQCPLCGMTELESLCNREWAIPLTKLEDMYPNKPEEKCTFSYPVH